jgi:hypothetical protein
MCFVVVGLCKTSWEWPAAQVNSLCMPLLLLLLLFPPPLQGPVMVQPTPATPPACTAARVGWQQWQLTKCCWTQELSR